MSMQEFAMSDVDMEVLASSIGAMITQPPEVEARLPPEMKGTLETLVFEVYSGPDEPPRILMVHAERSLVAQFAKAYHEQHIKAAH